MFKILVVDDEEDILDLLTYNLEKEGYDVHRATNGEDAIKIAEKILPDLVILDIMMAHKDGVETCRSLRANPLHKDISIVFLTARTEEYSELAGFEVGADDYITKPIKPRLLMSRLKAILRRNMPENESLNDGNTLQVSDIEIKETNIWYVEEIKKCTFRGKNLNYCIIWHQEQVKSAAAKMYFLMYGAMMCM